MSWEDEAKKVFESARQGTKQEEVNLSNDEQPPVENSNQDVWTPVVGEHFKSPDEFKAHMDSYGKLKQEYELMSGMIQQAQDPLNYFSSPEAYKREQLLKARKDIPVDVASKIVTSDLSNLSPLETLKLNFRLEHPEITNESDIEELLKEKYGDYEGEEVTSLTKNKMLIDSKSAIKNIEQLRSELKEPEKFDIKSMLEGKQNEYLNQAKEREGKWKDAYEKVLMDKIKEIVITDKDENGKEAVSFRYKLDDEFLQAAKEDVSRLMAFKGVNPDNEEAIKSAVDEIQVAYLFKNFGKIIKAAQSEVEAKTIERMKREDQGMLNPTATKPEDAKSWKNPSATDIIQRSSKLGLK